MPDELPSSTCFADVPKSESTMAEPLPRPVPTKTRETPMGSLSQLSLPAASSSSPSSRKDSPRPGSPTDGKRLSLSISNGFLSCVPEVDSDIQFQLSVFVVGEAADIILDATCRSREAMKLANQGIRRRKSEGENQMRPVSTLTAGQYTCLCRVSFGERSGLAKLRCVSANGLQGGAVPEAQSAEDARSMVVVFGLRAEGHISSIRGQLNVIRAHLQELRSRTIRERRPRCSLLVALGSQPPPELNIVVDTFSRKNELSFTEVPLGSGEDLYRSFGTLASSVLSEEQDYIRNKGLLRGSPGKVMTIVQPTSPAETFS